MFSMKISSLFFLANYHSSICNNPMGRWSPLFSGRLQWRRRILDGIGSGLHELRCSPCGCNRRSEHKVEQLDSSGSFPAGQPVGGVINKTVNSTIPSSVASVSGVYATPGSRADLFQAPGMLKSLDAISEKDVVLDVSSRRSPGEAHIRGGVHIPAKSFFYENGTLRSVSELAAILGKAGISSEDAVMVYSDSFSSGEATAVLCMLRYLGQEDARALDGGLDNWIAASLPLETKENVRSPVSYAARPRADLLADYDFVKSGQAQMVDARSFQEYGKARIG